MQVRELSDQHMRVEEDARQMYVSAWTEMGSYILVMAFLTCFMAICFSTNIHIK